MKIVIDIDDEDYYDLIEKSKQYPIDMFTNAQSSIIKGTTLDSVLDEIKTEIEKFEYLSIEDGSDGYDEYVSRYDLLDIIDKYKEK